MQNTALAHVHLSNCHQLKNTKDPFILVLELGDDLFASILACAKAINLPSASISGLGALDDVTVAYYDLPSKSYETKLFHGMFELISLNGNITTVDNEPFVHIHAALGTREYDVVGGHIMSATVGPSAEITVIPLPSQIKREYDDRTGLKVMCPIR